jgi:flagellar basal-body rod protein FlgG
VVVDGSPVDTLRIVNVPDPATLRKDGEGRYSATGATVPANLDVTGVRQGVVEESNSDGIHGLVDLISIQRAYAANLTALRVVDGVLDTAVNQVGKV